MLASVIKVPRIPKIPNVIWRASLIGSLSSDMLACDGIGSLEMRGKI
jgi:hypothetical protein